MSPEDSAIRIRQVHRFDRREATAVVRCYHECFSADQRIADTALIALIDEMPDSRENAFYIAESGDDLLGFAYILFFPSFRMAHLMYLGISAEGRGRGAGRLLFRRLVEHCSGFASPPHWITVEAIRPEAAVDPDVRASRESTVAFLEKVGCLKVEADFQAPPLGPGQPVVPHWIMACPVGDQGVDPTLVPEMLLVIYRQVYGLPEDHQLVLHCLESVGSA